MKDKGGVCLGDAFMFQLTEGLESLCGTVTRGLCFSISISNHLPALFTVCGMVPFTTFTPVCAKGLYNAECGLKCVKTSSRSSELALSLISKSVKESKYVYF